MTVAAPADPYAWEAVPHRGAQRYKLYSQYRLGPCDSGPDYHRYRIAGHWEGEFRRQALLGPPWFLPDGKMLSAREVREGGSERKDVFALIGSRGEELWSKNAAELDTSRGLTHVLDSELPRKLEVLWLSQDQRTAFVKVYDSLMALKVATGGTVDPAPLLNSEFTNGQADTSTLLLASAHLPSPPDGLRQRLEPLSGTARCRNLQLGWHARLGDAGARAKLMRNLAAAYRAEDLEGLALLGREASRPLILSSLLRGESCAGALGILGESGDDIVIEALNKAPQSSNVAVEAVLKAAEGRDNPRFWLPLSRFCLLDTRAAYSATHLMSRLSLPDRDQRFMELLAQRRGDPGAILDYFQSQPNRQISSFLLNWLQPGCESLPAVIRVLQFQNRVDFGLDVQAWRRWLREGRKASAIEKARILQELGEPTALLWQAHLGRLNLQQLQRCPRVQAVWPIVARWYPDGQLVSSNDPDAFSSSSAVLNPATGVRLPTFEWHLGSHTVRSSTGGWRMDDRQTLAAYFSPFGERAIFGNRIFDGGEFYNLEHGYEAVLSPTRSEVAEPDDRDLRVLDYKSGRLLMNIPLETDPTWNHWQFSQDGDELLLSGSKRWRLYDRTGNILLNGRGYPTMAPDGTILSLDCNELRFRDRKVAWMDVENPIFFPDSQTILIPSRYDRLSLLDGELRKIANFWGAGGDLSARPDGHQFAAADWFMGEPLTWIYETHATRVPRVSPEQQTLLCELWTGAHLRGGMAETLSAAEYKQRVQRWLSEGGGSWYADPRDLSSDSSVGVTLISALAVLALVGLRFLVARR